jgi:hypothetical protein
VAPSNDDESADADFADCLEPNVVEMLGEELEKARVVERAAAVLPSPDPLWVS